MPPFTLIWLSVSPEKIVTFDTESYHGTLAGAALKLRATSFTEETYQLGQVLAPGGGG